MRTIAKLAFLCAACIFTTVRADDDEGVERAVPEFVRKLSAEGPGGKLLEIAKTEAGRRAIAEAMQKCVAWELRGFERDPETHFEKHLFDRDDNGTLRPRPERAAEFDLIRQSLESVKSRFAAFNEKADVLVGFIDESTELDKRVKAAWKDPRYRLARFAGFEEDEDEEGGGESFSDFFREVELNEFERRGDRLGVPANRFAEEEGEVRKAATPEDADKAVRETVREFAERQTPFTDMAERCADASIAELFSAPIALPALEGRMRRVMRSLERAVLEKAPSAFARRYLAGTGDKMAWRADRATKVDEIADRAREIEAERAAEESGADQDENP